MKKVGLKRIRQLFTFDPDTGLFTRKIRSGVRTHVGQVVRGTKQGKGYLQMSIDWRLYTVTHVVWLYMTGRWPTKEIDHINGIRTDNRFSNLREVTRSVNMQNRRTSSPGTITGLLGVVRNKNKHRNKYDAQITINKKSRYLGSFSTPQKAYLAYVKAKRKYHEGCTI